MTGKARLALRASDLGVLSAVPCAFDLLCLYVPDAVWTDDTFAKRWFRAGGMVPLPAPRAARARDRLAPRTLTKALKRRAVAAGRDWANDAAADGRLGSDGDDGADAARDIADGVLCSEGFGASDRRRLMPALADDVYEGILRVRRRKRR